MRGRAIGLAVLGMALLAGPAPAQPAEGAGVVAEVRVHGNHTTPEADILALAGDLIGRPATDAVVADARSRLAASGRFESVEVRKRYRSIDDPADVLLVIVVDERPAVSSADLTPGPFKRFRASGMFLPVLGYEDGYGFTYGARVSFMDRFGRSSRVSVPLTWGGRRQARVEVEKTFSRGRVGLDAGVTRRENPHYAAGDTRAGFRAMAEAAPRRWLRVGMEAGSDDVRFGDDRDTLTQVGARVTIDTRVDPAFPRNAIFATVGRERLGFDLGNSVRTTADVRAYVGAIGQAVLAVRGLSITANRPLPPYEHALIGGSSTLRGYDAGYRAGDNLAAVSAELRLPLTSPLSAGRMGVKVFVDAGTAYRAGARLRDQTLERGVGAGAYLHLAMLNLSCDVAWPERGGGPNLHVGLGVTFK